MKNCDNIDKLIISQSNKLTMAKQNLTVACRRLFYYIAYRIKNATEEEISIEKDTPYMLTVSNVDLIEFGVTSKTNELHRILDELKKYNDKNFCIYINDIDENGKRIFIGTSWILEIISKGPKTLFTISKTFTRFIRCNKSCFTMFDCSIPVSFKSVYTQRFFEICHQYENFYLENKRHPYISVKDLIHMFNLENVKSYKNIGNFEQRVLKVACDELCSMFDNGKSDIFFYYEKIKDKSTKEYYIKMDIRSNNKSKAIELSKRRIALSIIKTCEIYIKNQENRMTNFEEYMMSLNKPQIKNIEYKLRSRIDRYEDLGKSDKEIAMLLSSILKEEYGI